MMAKAHNETLAAVRIAVAAERERCAKIAEGWYTALGATIAAEIRAAVTTGQTVGKRDDLP